MLMAVESVEAAIAAHPLAYMRVGSNIVHSVSSFPCNCRQEVMKAGALGLVQVPYSASWHQIMRKARELDRSIEFVAVADVSAPKSSGPVYLLFVPKACATLVEERHTLLRDDDTEAFETIARVVHACTGTDVHDVAVALKAAATLRIWEGLDAKT